MGHWSDHLKLASILCFQPQITGSTEKSNKKTPAVRTKTTLLLCLPFLLCLNSMAAMATEWVYTMKSGDNLWDLSKEHMGSIDNWQPLQKLNNVIDPKHLPPGTKIRFPLAWLKIKPAPVRILELAGEVNAISTQTGAVLLLTPGATLVSGDEIHTGTNGNVLLEFLDNSQLLLQKNSHLIFEKQNSYSGTGILDVRIHLPRGRIETTINPEQKKGTRFEIHTPAAITGVRGTEFRVAIGDNQETGITEVTHGMVAVSGTTGKTVKVPASFGIVVTAGQPPSNPKPLLPAPDLSQLPNLTELFPLVFDWLTVDGAEFYRAQISHAAAAGALLIDEAALQKPQLHTVELPDGDYLLRVRAIDTDGLEGFNAEHKFTLAVPIEPPLLIMPLRDAKMRKQPPDFRWEIAKNAATYHVQLSTNSDFSAPLIDISNYQGTSLKFEQTLAPGEYYWRVASRTAFGKQSMFSPTQHFSLQPKSSLSWIAFFLPLFLL